MEKNKTGKYLKYAIGEIVLVVIGILIALQINTWNEGRKQVKQGKAYANEIFNDVKDDIIYLESIINKLEEQKLNSGQVLNVFESENKYVSDSVAFVAQNLSTNMPISVNRRDNTYDELKATGKLGMIANDSVITRVKQFYEVYDYRISQYFETPAQARKENRTTFQECLDKASADRYEQGETGKKQYNKSWFECYLNNKKAEIEVRIIYSSSHWQAKHFKNVRKTGQSVIDYMNDVLETK